MNEGEANDGKEKRVDNKICYNLALSLGEEVMGRKVDREKELTDICSTNQINNCYLGCISFVMNFHYFLIEIYICIRGKRRGE